MNTKRQKILSRYELDQLLIKTAVEQWAKDNPEPFKYDRIPHWNITVSLDAGAVVVITATVSILERGSDD
jgi:hypothetical protein